MTGVTFVQPIIASVLTFIVYSLLGNQLTPPLVFSSIALFNTLRIPLMMLPMSITNATDAWVSLGRVQAMLLAPELEEGGSDVPKEKGRVEIQSGDFVWEAPIKILPDAKKGKAEEKRKAMGVAGTMRRGAYGETVEEEVGGIRGWMRKTLARTRRGNVGRDAREAVKAVDGSNGHANGATNGTANGASKQTPDAAPFTGLHDISLTAEPGQLVAIVGRVGAGKSSILSALIGEMKRTKGTGGIGGSIAYAPQTPWIQNATVRENVLFGLPFDETRYRRAVYAAALERDLEILPDGEWTEIGERGITLSGGQKARVSLARAIYADSDVVLLDDPLSAVDANGGLNNVGGFVGFADPPSTSPRFARARSLYSRTPHLRKSNPIRPQIENPDPCNPSNPRLAGVRQNPLH